MGIFKDPPPLPPAAPKDPNWYICPCCAMPICSRRKNESIFDIDRHRSEVVARHNHKHVNTFLDEAVGHHELLDERYRHPRRRSS